MRRACIQPEHSVTPQESIVDTIMREIPFPRQLAINESDNKEEATTCIEELQHRIESLESEVDHQRKCNFR